MQGAELLGSKRLAENEVAVSIPDDCRPIWGDATDIQQVITNLALNACDAKAEGRANRVGLTVMPQFFTVPTRAPDVGERPAEADCSVFVISDNGTGIDPAHRAQLFDRYFTTKGNKGTGLGMPIVASIIRENDAALWFDTVPGKGSTVTVVWPSQAPARFANMASHAKSLSAEAPLSELRLLIVDDVPDVADVLASLVGMAGATVVVVNDSAKARDLITNPKESWSAILTDFDMPGLSGVDLARAAASITPPPPVVLVTALPERAERNRDLFAAISPKPVDAPRLIDLIRSAVARQPKS
jgi:CheY-like chemotaxis protein